MDLHGHVAWGRDKGYVCNVRHHLQSVSGHGVFTAMICSGAAVKRPVLFRPREQGKRESYVCQSV